MEGNRGLWTALKILSRKRWVSRMYAYLPSDGWWWRASESRADGVDLSVARLDAVRDNLAAVSSHVRLGDDRLRLVGDVNVNLTAKQRQKKESHSPVATIYLSTHLSAFWVEVRKNNWGFINVPKILQYMNIRNAHLYGGCHDFYGIQGNNSLTSKATRLLWDLTNNASRKQAVLYGVSKLLQRWCCDWRCPYSAF